MTKKLLLWTLNLVFLIGTGKAQTRYESALGFSLNFDKTWKRLPKETLNEKVKIVKEFLDYRKDVTFDACYQKIGNSDLAYPYILLKNVYSTTTDEEEITKIQEYYSTKNGFKDTAKKIVNGKFDFELKLGRSYYDVTNRILIIAYDFGIIENRSLVGLFAFYIGKKGSLITFCYSYKEEFNHDQKEFLEIIYSVKDKGMSSTMDEYKTKHDIAASYYNQGRLKSDEGDRQTAINLYSKAISNYPMEDTDAKAEAYYNRGLNKRYLKDIKGAITDYTEAIKLRPGYVKAYNNRGYARLVLEDFSGAILDFNATIKFDNYNTEFSNMALGNRGIAKLSLGQEGCEDLRKAIQLGNKSVGNVFKEYCH